MVLAGVCNIEWVRCMSECLVQQNVSCCCTTEITKIFRRAVAEELLAMFIAGPSSQIQVDDQASYRRVCCRERIDVAGIAGGYYTQATCLGCAQFGYVFDHSIYYCVSEIWGLQEVRKLKEVHTGSPFGDFIFLVPYFISSRSLDVGANEEEPGEEKPCIHREHPRIGVSHGNSSVIRPFPFWFPRVIEEIGALAQETFVKDKGLLLPLRADDDRYYTSKITIAVKSAPTIQMSSWEGVLAWVQLRWIELLY
jgi:hypothetical protein